MGTIGTYDREGVEARILHDIAGFNGKSVLEIGCGDGRMTWYYAHTAASVLAFDPDEEAIAIARAQTPDPLGSKIEFRVAGLLDVDVPEDACDIAVFAWSI
jgi:ubiquinone/menaquinone biosynthesis C-methylase UbiE